MRVFPRSRLPSTRSLTAFFFVLLNSHRLNTIIESTRVLVLDQGRVAEFDVPTVLLADKSSRFYSMALEAGLVQEDGEVGQDGRVRQAREEKESRSADEVQEQAGGGVDK